MCPLPSENCAPKGGKRSVSSGVIWNEDFFSFCFRFFFLSSLPNLREKFICTPQIFFLPPSHTTLAPGLNLRIAILNIALLILHIFFSCRLQNNFVNWKLLTDCKKIGKFENSCRLQNKLRVACSARNLAKSSFSKFKTQACH